MKASRGREESRRVERDSLLKKKGTLDVRQLQVPIVASIKCPLVKDAIR